MADMAHSLCNRASTFHPTVFHSKKELSCQLQLYSGTERLFGILDYLEVKQIYFGFMKQKSRTLPWSCYRQLKRTSNRNLGFKGTV
jgi:hypothetical protein